MAVRLFAAFVKGRAQPKRNSGVAVHLRKVYAP